MFTSSLGDRNCGLAGRYAVISCSKTAPDTSSTTRRDAETRPLSVSVGVPAPSFATNCQRVWVQRWKPMPMQLMAVASVSVVASTLADPSRRKKVDPLWVDIPRNSRHKV
jgi:hypothetical protein